MTGQRVGNWVLGAELGRGPLGVVYRATSVADGRTAAVKVLAHPAAASPAFLQGFPAAMLPLHRLDHPNVAKYYDAGVHAGAAWFAAELVEGTDLATLLKTRPKLPDEPGLSWSAEGLALAVQAARGLKHGHHRSVLHRGLKPSNVILTPDGTAKLTDFGLGKLFEASPLNVPPEPLGTAAFLAPEFFTGKPLTRKSDLYALGGVLYAAVNGRPQFTAATPAEYTHKHCYALPERPARFVPDLPPDLDELICSLLAKDPARRPPTAAAVMELLDHVRGKAERRGVKVAWPAGVGDQSEPHPALGADDGALTDASRPRPLLSRPAVVVPLFLAVVAAMLLGYFWPQPDPDAMFAQAQALLATDDPANWEAARDDYLEPLARRFPEKYDAELTAARARIGDREALRHALDAGGRAKPRTEGERLYLRGLALARAGDAAGARQVWESLAAGFAGVPAEARWVGLARLGLEELAKRPAVAVERTGLTAALDRAKGRAAAEKAAALDALEKLYRDDPPAVELIRAAR